MGVGAALLELEPSAATAETQPTSVPPDQDTSAQAPTAPADVVADKPLAQLPEQGGSPASRTTSQPTVAPVASPPVAAPNPASSANPVSPADKQPSKSSVDVPGDGRSSAAAGPAVRRLARELGVDLRRIRPSGEGQRITTDDVRIHVRVANEQVAADAPQGVTPPGTPDSDAFGAVRREKMSRMRQTIARTMFHSYNTIPQLTNFDDVDITELERIRQDSKGDYAATGVKLTTMPFLIKAVASALRLHPIINASIDEENQQTIYKEYVNVGVAVDTERGLVVPVLRDTDRKSIPQIVHGLIEMATAVRAGDFGLDDLRGGTFTISNLGAIGGTYSTPIINPPEVAILLAGRSRMMPQFIDGSFQPRLMLPLSLTYDHRIVDGAAAARFLNDVKGLLANPGRLLLAP